MAKRCYRRSEKGGHTIAKKTNGENAASRRESLPKTLKGHIFYGLKLDDEQIVLGDMILDEHKKLVMCSAKSGSGKTTVAVATAVMMVESGAYDKIVYCVHPVNDAQGFLPGTISEKSEVWFEGLYQALVVSNQNPSQAITNTSIVNMKNDSGFVKAVTDTYLRGTTIGASEKTIFIIDEAQNFDEHSLRKTLSRANDDSKVIVLGHEGQIDLVNRSASGFVPCMKHFMSKQDDRFGFCTLSVNHRGLVSSVADEPWEKTGEEIYYF